MKFKNAFFLLASVLLVAQQGLQAQQSSVATVQSLGFQYQPQEKNSKIEIVLDQEVAWNKEEMDDQVTLVLESTALPSKWARPIDTFQQKANIAMITPVQEENKVKIILKLKEKATPEIQQEGKKLIVFVENTSPTVAAAPELAPQTMLDSMPEDPMGSSSDISMNGDSSGGSSDSSQSALDTFYESQKTKNYVGKRIYLQVRDAELADVFRIISEASEFNIVLSDKVQGKVMLNLNDVPWDQALDLILKGHRLAAERYGNVLRVTTLDALSHEKEAEAFAQKASEAAEPLVAKIFPISYADITELSKVLEDFLSNDLNAMASSSSSGSGFGGGQSSGATSKNKRGTIQVDSRTNSLVVRDTAASIEKIKRIIKELDTQTPQILIEAKFVSVKESNSKDVNGRIYATSREFNTQTQQYEFNNAKLNLGGLLGGPNALLGTGFALTPIGVGTGGGSFGFTPQANLLPGIKEIGAFLNILENESNAKIIASPRLVTQNKKPASISEGKQISLQTPSTLTTSGGFQSVSAELQLTVTPQVTNDGSIMVKLLLMQQAPGDLPKGASFSLDTKKIDTQVLVDSGGTLVIGGIYSDEKLKSSYGIPFLRDIPIIGTLFGGKSDVVNKSEMFIFLTPRILNEKEAGFSG